MHGLVSIGRIHYVPPSLGDIYYMRILLNKVHGPKCFDDIKIVNGQLFQTFKEACFALGLLEDDQEYINAIKEASEWSTTFYLRQFFVTLLLSNSLLRPHIVWYETWQFMCEDILFRQQQQNNLSGIVFTEQDLKNIGLATIEEILTHNGSSLIFFPEMPFPDIECATSFNNVLIRNELQYDKDLLKRDLAVYLKTLTREHKGVFDSIISSVNEEKGGVFFVYGYGGTGKTFLWNTLSAAIRSKGEIVLNVASSGIASLLLLGGRTAHSRFLIPINITEDSVCSIDANSDLANLIKKKPN